MCGSPVVFIANEWTSWFSYPIPLIIVTRKLLSLENTYVSNFIFPPLLSCLNINTMAILVKRLLSTSFWMNCLNSGATGKLMLQGIFGTIHIIIRMIVDLRVMLLQVERFFCIPKARTTIFLLYWTMGLLWIRCIIPSYIPSFFVSFFKLTVILIWVSTLKSRIQPTLVS